MSSGIRSMSRSAVALTLSLAVVIGLGMTFRAAKAGPPAKESAKTKASPGATALETAAKHTKYLFIFFWRDDTQHSRAMRGVFQSALEKMTDRAESIEIRTEDAAEKQLVTRFGVSRAPMPMVLAIAPNGAITKGLPTRFSEEQLRQAFVSRGTAECMKFLQARKLVLLCVEPASPKVRQVSLQKGVEEFTADKEYAESSTVVRLDAGDAAEAAFLKDLKVDPRTTERVTVLISPPAAVVGTFVGDVTKEQLVAKLKAAQSSCCPGGKCGPGGCCPK
jgi:hypothetical protein